MDVATSVQVGVRELKNNLSRYLTRAREGTEVIVTDRGRPVARLCGLDAPTNRLAELIDQGLVQPPTRADRYLPVDLIDAKGTVSDLVAEQQR